MHAVIIEDIEGYLAGDLLPAFRRRLEAHLETCSGCRREIEGMRELTALFASLKPSGTVEPSSSFVARVLQDVVRRPTPTMWSPFSDFAFGRRVAFASLLTLAILGTVLVSRESSYAPGPATPEAVMASDQGSPSPDRMLVTLTAYEP